MERLSISGPSTILLVVGDREAPVDLFELRLWSDEAGKRLGDFNSVAYFNEMRDFLAEKCPAIEPEQLSIGQLIELHNTIHEATEQLLETQKKRNTNFAASLIGMEVSMPLDGNGTNGKHGTTTSTESSPNVSGTSET